MSSPVALPIAGMEVFEDMTSGISRHPKLDLYCLLIRDSITPQNFKRYPGYGSCSKVPCVSDLPALPSARVVDCRYYRVIPGT